MLKKRSTKLMCLLIAFLWTTIVIGSSYAYFIDTVNATGNIVTSGNLKAALSWKNPGEEAWKDASQGAIFNYQHWEPGYTDVKYIKVQNTGNLAFQYELNVFPAELLTGRANLLDVLEVYYGENVTGVTRGNYADRLECVGTLTDLLTNAHGAAFGILLPENPSKNGELPAGVTASTGSVEACMVLHMQETAGNEYQNLSVGDGFKVQLAAAQYMFEKDSFGNLYDQDADEALPELNIPTSMTIDVTPVNGLVPYEVRFNDPVNGVSATVPAGAKMADGATSLTLVVEPKKNSEAKVNLTAEEELFAYNVKVEGLAADNTVPVVINMGEVLPNGLNLGNYDLYHVENGLTVKMTLVDNAADLDAHNEFTYAPVNGAVSVAMATFSEVALVANTENAWNGTVATAFSGGDGTEVDPYIVANADQLAYMGDQVSNDNGNYGSAYYKLISDINIGGVENYNANGRKVLFYPIGYNKVGGTTTDKGNWYTYGGSFKGVFDGNGHKVTGIYQNTWAMVGDYSGTYYNDAMGLFGYVNGGTVKNLTIDNFYSEGEFAPTGCVTAYAAGKVTFENIAITNSHPQTYNTGVAGIVGWDEGDNSDFTFKNITVDSTNTVSALWGSWDVAAAGILGYLSPNSKANLDNCHVAATIDVYNDVCGNYQYYWYRYCGAFIGTVDKRLDNGKGALDLSNVTAKNCTVNFGDRHEYYYCEFEENTQASYTDDYQFSRVDHSELNMDAKPVTCMHTHTPNEDKQAVYIPFRQLFGGYGWGVDGVDLGEYDDIQITVVDGSTEKFTGKISDGAVYHVGDTVEVGDLFAEISGVTPEINKNNVQVFVSPVGDDSTAGGTYIANTGDWTQGTLTFTGKGEATITITDYYFCTETKITVEITAPDFMYRVGNQSAVTTEQIAKLLTGKESSNVSIETHVGNVEWNGNNKFTGTGIVKVVIDGTTYYLEVVEAVNATSAASAMKNNVVLLSDCNFSTITVSNGYTLYGNGFKMTNTNDVLYHSLTVGYVTVDDGTLDNVQIVVPNFSHAVLYNSNMTESSNYYDSNSQKYGNVRSAVLTSGNSKILNSYVSGGRAAVYVTGGETVIDNSTIVGGAAANIHVVDSANALTLRDVTMIQKPMQATVHDTSKTLMGLSVLMMCGNDKYGAKLNLEGELNQYAWAHEGYKTYVPAAGQSFVKTVLGETDYIHKIAYPDGKTYDSLNLGFAFLPTGTTAPANPSGNIVDNRNDGKPYDAVDINGSAYVYSYKNSKGTADIVKTEPVYTANTQAPILPTVLFTETNDNRVFVTEYDAAKGWMSTLTVDVDAGNYNFSFDKLLVQKYGKNLTYSVQTADGTDVDKSKTIALNDSATHEYILTITDNLIYDQNGNDTSESVYQEYTFRLLSTKTSIAAPTWNSTNLTGTALRVGESKTTTDWNVALPVLEGLSVHYYSKAQGKEVDLVLADVNLGDAGQKSDTNTYTLTVENEYTLTVTTTGFHSTDNGKPTVSPDPSTKKNTLYFTSSTYVSKSTASRSIAISYTFTDANNSPVLTHSTTWTVKYTDIQNSTRYDPEAMFEGETKEPCVTPDTLITLSDGSQVRVDSLTGDEKLLVWNMETGTLDAAPILFVDSDPEEEFEIIHLYFSDGTDVKVIYEHGFWDYDLNKYVYLDRNAEKYIGHTFAKHSGDALSKVKLTDVVIEKEVTTAWSPVTADHLCYFVNGMLSMPGGVGGLFNIFEVDPATMSYDMEALARDIDTYGLFTYEELNAIVELPEEMFNAAGGAYLKVSIGKGNLTMDELIYMIQRYTKYFK